MNFQGLFFCLPEKKLLNSVPLTFTHFSSSSFLLFILVSESTLSCSTQKMPIAHLLSASTPAYEGTFFSSLVKYSLFVITACTYLHCKYSTFAVERRRGKKSDWSELPKHGKERVLNGGAISLDSLYSPLVGLIAVWKNERAG